MPIEFRCTNCSKLLRTKDDTAGKQAKCPECGTVLQIPAASTAAPEVTSEVPPPPQDFRFAPTSPGTPANPFASPQYGGAEAVSTDFGERSGPPWERDGQSANTFIETAKQVLTNPTYLFATMRREGGFGKPLVFAIIGTVIGSVAIALFQMIGLSVGAMGGMGQNNAAEVVGGGIGGMLCTVVMAPVAVAISSFIGSGILHLMLMIVGGARFGFETTYRVLCYSAGTANLFNVIPFVGGLIGLIVQLVVSVIGLSKAHEISVGKAAIAVLLPALVCCGLIVLAIGGLFAVAIGGAANGNWN